jgi:DNA repair ATPase RecN
MTEESSQKQTGVLTGKRKRLEDEEVDEDNEFRRVTRAMSEPDWVKKVMNRMDGVAGKMESFTDRVEKLERRLMDREKLEKKWRNDVGKQIENMEDLGYGHIENVKTVDRAMLLKALSPVRSMGSDSA